ncbi:coagulation factor V [Rhinatrema bivittatum]|uniref:coagulation factor V n=1 Tax=Rhinatrema bivittatum TaxID=194408 RepID=UPI00112C85C0|nr:coagulation factor V [Rhinatrema bivittatum]
MGPRRLSLLLGLLLGSLPVLAAVLRRHHIAAVPLDWSYGSPEAQSSSSGNLFKKIAYREYEAGFQKAKPTSRFSGILGPTLRAEVGDTLEVTFKNLADKPLTILPQGINYGKRSEGALYADNTFPSEKKDDAVLPGEAFTYVWEITKDIGPKEADPACLTYVYYSHQDMVQDLNAGLIGPLLICKEGSLKEDGSQKMFDREYVLMFAIFDEGKSWFKPPSLEEGALMYTINGYINGTSPDAEACNYDNISWHIIGMSSSPEIFSIHFNAQVLEEKKQKVSVINLVAAASTTANMTLRHEGRWLISSLVHKHLQAGMHAYLKVTQCTGKETKVKKASFLQRRQIKSWEYFIAAEEVVWDYTFSFPENADRSFCQQKKLYKKAVFRQYTDGSFSKRVDNSVEAGILGPIIRAQVRDSVKIVFRNMASRPYSIYPHGVTLPKSVEGASYPPDLTGNRTQNQAVNPGETFTYLWSIMDTDEPTANDPQCLTRLYHSAVDMTRDIASGLIGPLLICKSMSLSTRGNQRKADLEQQTLFAVFDENRSWHFEENLKKADKGASAIKQEDPYLYSSHVLHTINGYVPECSPLLGFCHDEVVQWHISSVGPLDEIVTVRLTGHYFQNKERNEDTLNLFPMHGESVSVEMDNIGIWLLGSLGFAKNNQSMRVRFRDAKCLTEDDYDYSLNGIVDIEVPYPEENTVSPKSKEDVKKEEENDNLDYNDAMADALGLRTFRNNSESEDEQFNLTALIIDDQFDIKHENTVVLNGTSSMPSKDRLNSTLEANKPPDAWNSTQANEVEIGSLNDTPPKTLFNSVSPTGNTGMVLNTGNQSDKAQEDTALEQDSEERAQEGLIILSGTNNEFSNFTKRQEDPAENITNSGLVRQKREQTMKERVAEAIALVPDLIINSKENLDGYSKAGHDIVQGEKAEIHSLQLGAVLENETEKTSQLAFGETPELQSNSKADENSTLGSQLSSDTELLGKKGQISSGGNVFHISGHFTPNVKVSSERCNDCIRNESQKVEIQANREDDYDAPDLTNSLISAVVLEAEGNISRKFNFSGLEILQNKQDNFSLEQASDILVSPSGAVVDENMTKSLSLPENQNDIENKKWSWIAEEDSYDTDDDEVSEDKLLNPQMSNGTQQQEQLPLNESHGGQSQPTGVQRNKGQMIRKRVQGKVKGMNNSTTTTAGRIKSRKKKKMGNSAVAASDNKVNDISLTTELNRTELEGEINETISKNEYSQLLLNEFSNHTVLSPRGFKPPVVVGISRAAEGDYVEYIPNADADSDDNDNEYDIYDYVEFNEPYLLDSGVDLNSYLNPDEIAARFLRSTKGKKRMYYIAAEEIVWDYSGLKKSTVRHDRVSSDTSGNLFKKVVFRSYQDGTFQRPSVQGEYEEHLGVLGPVIRAEVEDVIQVHFKNLASRPYSLHAHGVSYEKSSEGASYDDNSPDWLRKDDAVDPGGTYTYIWYANRRSGPEQSGPACKTWAYYSAVNPEKDIHSGLIGPLVICRSEAPDKDNYRPQDVREFTLLFMTFDESKSWYFEKSSKKTCTETSRPPSDGPTCYKFHAINGITYNLPGLKMYENELVRWHLLNMGGPKDIPVINFHGQTFTEKQSQKSQHGVYSLLPGSFATIEMTPSKAGLWLLDCELGEYQQAGMQAKFLVIDQPCKLPMGLMTGAIADSQITASNYLDSWKPYMARLNNAGAYNAWSTEMNKTELPWIQVDLQRPVVITGIQTQGARQVFSQLYVTDFVVTYSLDKRKWIAFKGNSTNVQKIFDGNSDASSIRENTFDPPIIARYIRVYPTKYRSRPTLRMELLGCETEGCFVPLGMESGSIKDEQITATSVYTSWFYTWNPFYARLNLQGSANAWQAKANNNQQWLQIDLLQPKRITGIITQGAWSLSTEMFVKAYAIHYSANGNDWQPYIDESTSLEKIFTGNTDGRRNAKTRFSPPIFSRFIRIIPKMWNQRIALRLEIFGCDIS